MYPNAEKLTHFFTVFLIFQLFCLYVQGEHIEAGDCIFIDTGKVSGQKK
jgi:hypothetical protein